MICYRIEFESMVVERGEKSVQSVWVYVSFFSFLCQLCVCYLLSCGAMGCLVIVVVTIMSSFLHLRSFHNRLNIIDKLCVHCVCNALCGSKDKRERERKFCYVLREVLSLNISLKVCVRERLELCVSSSLRTTNSFVYNEARVSSSSSWKVCDGWCVCVKCDK